MAQKRKIKGNN